MLSERIRVCVIGLWHLGVVTSVCLADLGYYVVGIDADASKVEALNQGLAPIYEPGLEELLARNLENGRLRYTAEPAEALQAAPYILITYDTPVDEQDEVDLSEIYQTTAWLPRFMQEGATIIVSSQVPVGTCEKLAGIIRQVNLSLDFSMAYIPENLRLGQAIERFKCPDMIVIGTDSPKTLVRVERLLSIIQAPRVIVDLRSAEMTKHAINAYMSVNISFANEVANLSDLVGADAIKVIEALRLDSRVSPHAPIFPGLGFAGGTLSRDLKMLRHLGQEYGYEAPLVNGVLRVNDLQNSMVVRRLKQFYGSLRNLTVGVLGLTYKAGTSTLRRSAAVEIIKAMAADGAEVKAYDPKADPKEVEPYLNYFTRCDSPYDVAEGSQALILVTPWPEFKELDFHHIRLSMQNPFILDAQNLLDPDQMVQKGFVYQGVGRARTQKAERADL